MITALATPLVKNEPAHKDNFNALKDKALGGYPPDYSSLTNCGLRQSGRCATTTRHPAKGGCWGIASAEPPLYHNCPISSQGEILGDWLHMGHRPTLARTSPAPRGIDSPWPAKYPISTSTSGVWALGLSKKFTLAKCVVRAALANCYLNLQTDVWQIDTG